MVKVTRFLNRRDIAERLRCHPNSVPRLVRQGRLPSPVRLSRTNVRWPESEFEAWVQTQIKMRDQAADLNEVKREQEASLPKRAKTGGEEPS
jgi:predicted DNA-binding transcriptional regulator AlpA